MAGTIDVEALRRFRAAAQWDNWLKDLTTEQYQLIYEQPVIDKQVQLMHDRDIWARPDDGSPAAGG